MDSGIKIMSPDSNFGSVLVELVDAKSFFEKLASGAIFPFGVGSYLLIQSGGD